MSKSEEVLKSCPFGCGEAAIECENCTGAVMFWVMCPTCHSSPGDRPTRAEAIAAWNRRSDPSEQSSLRARVAELEAALSTATDEVERLRAGLEKAAGWFEEYADGHQAKGALDKASRNLERANYLRRALTGGAK